MQMRPYIGCTLDTATYESIVEYVHHFLEGREALFAARVREGRIRDCHGDLRLQQIHVLDNENRLVILDCIEFNERFRYSDVASEIAFLVMELEAANRADLVNIDPALPNTDDFGQGLYDPDRTARTYEALLVKAEATLARGRSVLLDASFARQIYRQKAAQLAATHGASCLFVECVCPRDVALARLADRWQDRVDGNKRQIKVSSRASDGRPNLYDAQYAAWDTVGIEEERQIPHLVVMTMCSLSVAVEQVLTALHIPHMACRL